MTLNLKKFSDLVRISGFSHGTNVWLENAQDLITSGTCTVSDAISCRDDIMMHLIHSGIDPLFSFKTMEKVRKGKGLSEDDIKVMKDGGIPQWYIDSCLKIKYLFPRAHATAYVMMAYRIAFLQSSLSTCLFMLLISPFVLLNLMQILFLKVN